MAARKVYTYPSPDRRAYISIRFKGGRRSPLYIILDIITVSVLVIICVHLGTKYCLRRQFAVHETAISFSPETQEIKTDYEIVRSCRR